MSLAYESQLTILALADLLINCAQIAFLLKFGRTLFSMPYKDVAKRREAHKRYYLKNKALYILKNINRRKMLAKFVLGLKQKPCSDCGVQYPPYVMDFDHTGADVKLDSIARLARNGFSSSKILEEIKKCDLVCSNCHRERTYRRAHN